MHLTPENCNCYVKMQMYAFFSISLFHTYLLNEKSFSELTQRYPADFAPETGIFICNNSSEEFDIIYMN